jgi:hypothetical protein
MYATSRKIAGSRPDEVISFNLPNPILRRMCVSGYSLQIPRCTLDYVYVYLSFSNTFSVYVQFRLVFTLVFIVNILYTFRPNWPSSGA